MSDYLIFLTPLGENDSQVKTPILLENVEVGFNQLGWLVATDSRRQIAACFMPNAVRWVERVEDEASDEIDTIGEPKIELVN